MNLISRSRVGLALCTFPLPFQKSAQDQSWGLFPAVWLKVMSLSVTCL